MNPVPVPFLSACRGCTGECGSLPAGVVVHTCVLEHHPQYFNTNPCASPLLLSSCCDSCPPQLPRTVSLPASRSGWDQESRIALCVVVSVVGCSPPRSPCLCAFFCCPPQLPRRVWLPASRSGRGCSQSSPSALTLSSSRSCRTRAQALQVCWACVRLI
jgi:hypothetical protein